MTDIERLFREHYEAMYTLARCILYDDAEAKDMVSDVFTRLLEDGTVLLPSTAKGYLLRAVRNRCLNALSHKSMRERVEKMLPLETTDDDDDERWQAVTEAIDSLEPPVRREILLLRYGEDMSYEEVAQKLGVSKVTVYNHLSKAIQSLREKLRRGDTNGH